MSMGCEWIRPATFTTHAWGDNPEGWSLLQWINDEINASQPWKFSVAEDLQNNSWITKDTNDQGGAGFDAQWSAGFVHPIRDALASRSTTTIATCGRSAMRLTNNTTAMCLSESSTPSHTTKSPTDGPVFPRTSGPAMPIAGSRRNDRLLGAALVMTSPGVPMIFQGQEVLEDEYFQDTDPVDWSKEVTHAGIEQLYTDLIRLRRNWFNNTRGLQGSKPQRVPCEQ